MSFYLLHLICDGGGSNPTVNAEARKKLFDIENMV
jgi:hypothetical protein